MEVSSKTFKRAEHVAVTIVSNNYLSFAKTLQQTYKKHHPGHDFIIALVDTLNPEYVEKIGGDLDIRDLGSFRIPDLTNFIYRYSIMELNTAVKPFVLNDLLTRHGYRTALYIDPDIQIFAPLDEVYKALETSSVALIPHMRRPYFDDKHPSDTSIIQSGTYNLGFVGLKAGDSASRLLYWWMTKLYRDCIVDIPNGLFVDQKWMDMVPGFFPDHTIIYHQGYNAAYWNLHERPISRKGETWYAGTESLVFYHYSGYSPLEPHRLSKHQNRFQLENLPQLRALTDQYGALLLENGYLESSNWPYGFERLSNGVKLPMRLVRDAMQWASRRGVKVPDPFKEPDQFCRFLMSRGTIEGRPNVSLLLHFIVESRVDVANAFPGARRNSDDPGFRAWLKSSGVKEEKIGDVMPFEAQETITDYVADAFARLRRDNRSDMLNHFADMWSNPEKFNQFADWFSIHGIGEMNFEREHTLRIRKSHGGIGRILNVYFVRGDLQSSFETLANPATIKAFADWLRHHSGEYDLTAEEISLFEEFAASSGALIDKARFLYSHKGRHRSVAPNIFNVDDVRYANRIDLDSRQFTSWLVDEPQIRPFDHYRANFGTADPAEIKYSRLSVEGVAPRDNFRLIESILTDVKSARRTEPLINLAGFLNAPSGVGEAARSMQTLLGKTKAACCPFTLPNPRSQSPYPPVSPVMFGWPAADADISIAMANADSRNFLDVFLPPTFWSKHNIGYWFWETEQLPLQFRESSEPFDEIWTASTYSAEAIRRTTGGPVRVIPLTLDFESLDAATRDRQRFGLPEDAVLFGFVFDPHSVFERKNVQGLIEAFDHAVRPDDNCYLVLKLNGRSLGSFEFEMLKVQSENERILFVEGTLSREDSFSFMKSLDVYISLHRSEGFGLTCAEAMAMGMPVIASNYSGNLEFMDGKNSLLVPAPVVETERAFGAYPAGTRWGNPDVEAAAVMIRSMLDERARSDLGLKAQKSVRKKLDPVRLGKMVARALSEVTGGQPVDDAVNELETAVNI